MVIVTKNQYVLASKIHSVTLNEDHDWVDISIGRHTVNVKEYKYTISIWYTPDQQNPNPGRDDWKECSINLRGRVDAHMIYRDLVRQIREQMPDALFLDQALEQLLKASDMAAIQLEEDQCKKEEDKHYDKIASKIRRTRKTKESVKKFYEELNQSVDDLSKEIGVNGYFQDNEGTVYKIVVPKGKWVAFEPLSYVRTRRMDEEASPLPLSLKEAEAAGFTVAKKK